MSKPEIIQTLEQTNQKRKKISAFTIFKIVVFLGSLINLLVYYMHPELAILLLHMPGFVILYLSLNGVVLIGCGSLLDNVIDYLLRIRKK